MHKLREMEASSLIKELEVQLSDLNHELDSMCTDKKELENQPENLELQAKFSSLEKISKQMDDRLSSLIKEVDSIEIGSVSEVTKIKGLMTQVHKLQVIVDCLHAQNSEREENLACKSNDVSNLHEGLADQLKAMQRNNSELETQIEEKAQENSKFQMQIENLRTELATKTADLQKEQEEKHHLLACLQKLESENGGLREEIEGLQGKTTKLEDMLKEREEQLFALQKKIEDKKANESAHVVALRQLTDHLEQEFESKRTLKEQVDVKNQEIDRLTQDKSLLQEKISELERNLDDRGDELHDPQNDPSMEIGSLIQDVTQLQHEMDSKHEQGEGKEGLQVPILELKEIVTEKEDEITSLTAQTADLQQELSDEKQKCERLTQMETQNTQLLTRIVNLQSILKQQEETINELCKESTMVKGRFLQSANRKMDEVAGEFRKTFEGKLRILSQRIRVAEQLHVENKDNYKKIKDRCEQQHPKLEKKFQELESTNQAEAKKIGEVVDEMMKGMESLVNNFGNKQLGFLQRLSNVSDEIHLTKNWVRWTINEIKPWKNEPGGSPFTPVDEKEQDKVMKEKVSKLKAKLNKEKGDKVRLMKGMYELQKKVSALEKVVMEKEEGLMKLGQEKVEAIRQLCIWIEYHQDRCDHLKQMLSVKIKRSRGKSS